MQTTNADIFYEYQKRLVRRLRHDKKTIDAKLRHVRQFMRTTGDIDFRELTEDILLDFILSIESRLESDENPLSPSTIVHTLGDVKEFLVWLSTQPEYSMITGNLVECLKPSSRTVQLMHGVPKRYAPPMEQVRTLIDALPADTIWRRRDRAVVAFALLSGARVSAIRSLRLKHIDIEKRTVFQDGKVVDTKNSKRMLTPWFPVGSEIEQIVIDWIGEIRKFGAGDDDPLFPKAPNRIRDARKTREFEFWSGTQQIRDIFAAGAKRAGTCDFHPHAIRHTLTKFMFKVVTSAEEMKAWSQSLGHDDLGTTIEHYGTLENEHIQKLMNEIRDRLENPTTKEIIDLLPYASSTNLKVIRLLLTDGKGTSG